MTMSAHLSDAAQWAVGLAARLRMVQTSLADDPPAVRRDYLAEEIEREIRAVPEGRRRAYLEELAGRFPEGEAGAPAAQQAPAPAEKSPEELADELAAYAGALPAARLHEISARLQAAGFAIAVAVEAEGEKDEVPLELQRKLGLSPNDQLDRLRMVQLVVALTDLVVTLDQLVWEVWKNIAPNSRVRREAGAAGDLRKVAGPFLIASRDVSPNDLNRVLERTRQLVAGILAAIGSMGKNFAKSFLGRISPAAIKAAADAEPGFFVGPEQKCWRKYQQVFNETTGQIVESEITDAIVTATEDLILGPPRGD